MKEKCNKATRTVSIYFPTIINPTLKYDKIYIWILNSKSQNATKTANIFGNI